MRFHHIYLFLPLFSLLIACSESTELATQSNENGRKVISCDAENISGDTFLNNGESFLGAQTQSNDCAFNGKYSAKIDKKNSFGFTYVFDDVKEGDIIHASTWKKGNDNFGTIVIADDQGITYSSSKAILERQGDWSKLMTSFVVTKEMKAVKVYCFNPNEEAIYFDQLEIEVGSSELYEDFQQKRIAINIPQSAYDSITKFRDIALEQGVISKDLKKYFDAVAEIEGKQVPIEIRLKGDWTDHLEEDKWSFRIKIKGNNSYQGLKSFSVQSPKTRFMLMEWFAHRVFEEEDVLTTKIDLIPFSINGKDLGVFLLEEHFDKQLLERNKRREGPIVKFNEDGMWEVVKHSKLTGKWLYRPIKQAAKIEPFKQNRTYKSEALRKQFHTAQNQMQRYRNGDNEVSEYMNIDQMAKYIALIDLFQGYHGLAWHNQRFYANPVTTVLEPIGFDCLPGSESNDSTKSWIPVLVENKIKLDQLDFTRNLLNNKELYTKYVKYLKVYSSDEFLGEIFESMKDEIVRIEAALKLDYSEYHFQKEFFITSKDKIKVTVPYLKDELQRVVKVENRRILGEGEFINSVGLNVYSELRDSVKRVLSLENFHSSEVEIIAYGTKREKGIQFPLTKPIKVGSFESGKNRTTIEIEGKPNRLYFKAKNTGDSLLNVKVKKWKLPTTEASFEVENVPADFELLNGVYFLKKGDYSFTEDIVIPKGKKVVFEQGINLNLENNAGFISYSPIEMNGVATEKIYITSKDGSAGGFTVLSEGKFSRLSHVEFSNLNTLRKANWSLTGAVTFHESNVLIEHCKFDKNHCEDGLNLIRSSFTMKNSTVSNTFSDGLDADFCDGIIEKCTFEKTGNDGIDVSGSTILVKNCQITEVGDKGISGGENSGVMVEGTSIEKANIGLAAKDLSRVLFVDGSIADVNLGVASFRKKPEYGPAKLSVVNSKLSNVKDQSLIDLDSQVSIEGEVITGTEPVDIEEMYAGF